jgi:hypothetical protein
LAKKRERGKKGIVPNSSAIADQLGTEPPSGEIKVGDGEKLILSAAFISREEDKINAHKKETPPSAAFPSSTLQEEVACYSSPVGFNPRDAKKPLPMGGSGQNRFFYNFCRHHLGEAVGRRPQAEYFLFFPFSAAFSTASPTIPIRNLLKLLTCSN